MSGTGLTSGENPTVPAHLSRHVNILSLVKTAATATVTLIYAGIT